MLKLTDATGNTDVATYTYTPYGATISASGTLATTNPYRFDSGYYDSATGLYLFGHRYYQPALARWTQTDSQKHSGDLTQGNPYGFTGGDPLNRTDPTGRFSIGDLGSAFDFVKIYHEVESGDYESAYYDSLGAIGGGLVGAACT